jgi:hypothetical protein
MATKAGVGFSNSTNSFNAGVEIAKNALAQAGISDCDLAILYSTSKQDPHELQKGVRSIIGEKANLIGGWSVGVITKDKLGYGGYETGLTVMKSDTIKFDTFIQTGLGNGNEYEVGLELGKQIKKKGYQGNWNVFLKYDSIRKERKPLPMNMGTPIVKGMTDAFGGKWPEAVGIGLLGDMQFNPTHQWYGGKVVNQSAMALVMSGPSVKLDFEIIHGCKPSGGYHKITKVDGPVILEIDNKPAIQAIAEMLGPNSDKTWENYPLFVTLGWNKGDRFGDFKEEDYANRLCIAIDKERGGLVMLEDDMKEGVEVQLMRRDINNFDYINQRSNALLQKVGSRKPFLAFYIDCAGRSSAYCGSEREEAEEIQKTIGIKMPLMGVYSGVEMAKVGNTDMMALDWTGILCIYSE